MGGHGFRQLRVPDYGFAVLVAPRRTPPFLTNLKPSTGAVQEIEIEPGTGTTSPIYKRDKFIHFDIVSEDLGKPLFAFVMIDFKDLANTQEAKLIWRFDKIAPGTLNKERPPFSCQLDLNNIGVQPGCHSIAVVVSHEFLPWSFQPAEPGDVDVATWFYQVGVDKTDPNFEYARCEPDPTPTDGGTDARLRGGGL
jgi:hypothetical protein